MLADLALIPQTLLRARPVSVVIGGQLARVDSLSWHVISTMAKVFRVSGELPTYRRVDGSHPGTASPVADSGPDELVWAEGDLDWPHRPSQGVRMTFFWKQGGAAQLDGETVDIPPGSHVTVRCVPAALRVLCCDMDASTRAL